MRKKKKKERMKKEEEKMSPLNPNSRFTTEPKDRPSISEVLVERDACTKYEPEWLDVIFFQAKILVSQDIDLISF